MSFTVARETYLVLLLVLLLEINVFLAKGFGGQTFRDLELEQQLKILNKPYVKSFKVGDNDFDTFDCVDIYQQPAFSHPLLKGHKIQINPSDIPIPGRDHDKSASKGGEGVGFGNIAQTCPAGTVPIRRTRKEDLIMDQIRMKNSTQYYHYKNYFSVATLKNSGPYYGAYALINIQSPSVTEKTQFSEAFVRLQATKGDEDNFVQAGWMVCESVYGDTQPRLTISFAMFKEGKLIGGCTNLGCPGFVQTHDSLNLGMPITSSTYGGDQQEQSFLIYKDRIDGNWWVSYGVNNQKFGYWPSSLFTTLKDNADFIAWGGEVFTRTDWPRPQMGSGHFASEGYKKAAYFKSLLFLDSPIRIQRHHIVDWNQLSQNVSSPNCYTLAPYGTNGIFYGGPGGNC